MNEMVERCARAIYEKRNGAGCRPWSRIEKAHKEPYLSDVRAVIEAMREPTDDMKRNTFYAARFGYSAMIDAALASPSCETKERTT